MRPSLDAPVEFLMKAGALVSQKTIKHNKVGERSASRRLAYL